MVDKSTEDIGLKSTSLRPEMDMRLLDIEVREVRPEAMDSAGEVDRGVDTSDRLALVTLDAIGRMLLRDDNAVGDGNAEGN